MILTDEQQRKDWETRLKLVERRLAKTSKPFVLPERLEAGGFDVVSSFRGTTAQRDALYGIPTTDAEHVALANRQIVWFNTDLGWEESYYSWTGAPGLTVRGLVLGTPSGWYPTGFGPEMVMEPSNEIAVAATSYVQGWPGSVQRTGGAAWFTNDQGSIIVQRAGFYDLRAWTILLAGTGTPNFHLHILNSANTQLTKHDGGVVTLQSSLFTTLDIAMTSKFMKAGDKVLLWLHSGTGMVVHKGGTTDTRGQLIARYVRPPLVSN